MNEQVFGTKEWAEETCDILCGCPHGCWYCYARANCQRFDRMPSGGWVQSEPGVTWRKVERLERARVGKRIMMPAQSDIVPTRLSEYVEAIRRLLMAPAGHTLLLVSKPHLQCVEEICQQFQAMRHRLMFRFTIGSSQDDVLRFWEPGAPCLGERLECLRLAYRGGFATSVSAEPMLDAALYHRIQLVRLCGEYITDALWFGLGNSLLSRLALNKAPADVREAALVLLASYTASDIHVLYGHFRGNSGIKWKESIKQMVGVPVSTVAGEDK